MNYVDLFIGGTLILSVFRGYQRGVLLAFARMAGYIFGLFAAVYFSRSVGSWLDEKINLVEQVAGLLYNLIPLPKPVMTTAVAGMGLQELTGIIANLPLPNFYQSQMLTYLDNYQFMLAGSILSIGETIALILARTIVELLAFGILFFGTMFAVRRLGRLISWRVKDSAFGRINKLAGAALGLATGIFITVISLGLLVPVVVLGQMVQVGVLAAVGEQINSSLFVPLFLHIFTLFQASAGGVVPFASGIFNNMR